MKIRETQVLTVTCLLLCSLSILLAATNSCKEVDSTYTTEVEVQIEPEGLTSGVASTINDMVRCTDSSIISTEVDVLKASHSDDIVFYAHIENIPPMMLTTNEEQDESADLSSEELKAQFELEHADMLDVSETDPCGNSHMKTQLNKVNGRVYGPSGHETYYNLNMSGCVKRMKNLGYDFEYWVRDDGVKMFGDYIMVAADFETRPLGTILETTLGTAIVVDTGEFVAEYPDGIDIAVTWTN